MSYLYPPLTSALCLSPSAQVFTRKLLFWHKTIHRPLPWKGEKNPYLIWLSEIILQQTRAEQGLPYYIKFKKHFPDVKSLAEASEDEVLRLWQGLGYYTRARNLHAAAKYICNELHGKFPADYESIRKLRGVGDYTAAAIASFAFNLPYPVVDGNAFRVLSRVFGIKTPVDSAKGKQQFKALAGKLIPKKYPALFNQAIMDFGALQCIPANPDCGNCPFRNDCFAAKNKKAGVLPVKSKKIKPKERHFHYLVINEGNHVYLSKRTGNDIWKSLYEFPLIEAQKPLSVRHLMQTERWKEIFNGITVKSIKFSGNFKQSLSHQKICASFYEIQVSQSLQSKGIVRADKDFSEKFAFPGVIRLYFSNKYRYLFHY
ncbi:MAG TPA: A/G-specific adenine glycosylase [Chitinophagales bacterium]|nr:A/G-specific adenine glycosylase [Chitinophagales bacterium]